MKTSSASPKKSPKRVATKSSPAAARPPKKSTKKSAHSRVTVDYYPNRVPVYTAILGVSILLICALLVRINGGY